MVTNTNAEKSLRGDRVKKLREVRNLTQKQLSERLDIGEKEIWRYENEPSNPTALKLTKLAIFFGVSTDYLLGLTDNQNGSVGDDLDDQETEVIEALRSGDKLKAIQAIVGRQ